MRIAGEIVNYGSAAARSNAVAVDQAGYMATPDTKVGDRYCSLSPARPFGKIEASTDLSEELPKKQQPTEISSNWQAQCPSAGRASNIDVGSYRGCHPHPNCAYPCAYGPGVLAIGPV
jgi:hypothetical protein